MNEAQNPHYVTPEQADNMFCPFTMVGDGDPCEGPKCMAWRWKHVVTTEVINGFQIETVDSSTTHGYCGMVRS